jgi:hypothetical protein
MATGLRKVGDYVTRKIAGETIVVPIRAKAADLDFVYVLNEVGAAIWSQLDAGLGPEEIAKGLSSEFDVSHETAREDVAHFLQSLVQDGLLEGQGNEWT